MRSEAIPVTVADLDDLLKVSRKWNGYHGITGALFYSRGNFLQVIEGLQSDVDELFGMISRDPRHCDVIRLFREEIPQREFADWTKAFHRLEEGDAATQEGFNDLFRAKNTQAAVDAYAPKVRAFLRALLR